MNELVDKGFTMRNSSRLSGYPRSLLYYRQKGRNVPLDKDLKLRIEGIIAQRPSYGTRRVTEMIRRFGLTVNRKKVRRHMKELNLLHSHKKRFMKSVPRTMVVSRPNIF